MAYKCCACTAPVNVCRTQNSTFHLHQRMAIAFRRYVVTLTEGYGNDSVQELLCARIYVFGEHIVICQLSCPSQCLTLTVFLIRSARNVTLLEVSTCDPTLADPLEAFSHEILSACGVEWNSHPTDECTRLSGGSVPPSAPLS